MVEPFAGVLGAAAVVYVRPALPYALAFAAGAMIYVVVVVKALKLVFPSLCQIFTRPPLTG